MTQPKVGDTAVITAANRTTPYRAVFDGKTWRDESGSFCVDVPTSHRPLLVIDPEDRDQVELVYRAYYETPVPEQIVEELLDKLQRGLRRLLPVPEPTGLGAVVVDREKYVYVRGPRDDGRPWMGSDGRHRAYFEISSPEVRSEGITDPTNTEGAARVEEQ